MEYDDYLRWAADHFRNVVDYNYSVQTVKSGPTDPATGAVKYFEVWSVDRSTGSITNKRAKHVVSAVGGRPNMPKCLDSGHPRVIHSSQYVTSISEGFSAGANPKAVAVIGAGQSAAEIFQDTARRFEKSTLIIRGLALRPSDDSPL